MAGSWTPAVAWATVIGPSGRAVTIGLRLPAAP
jgi:hypothetical protein